jgi:hypothetical protein
MQSARCHGLQRCPDAFCSVLQPRLHHCTHVRTLLYTTQRQQQHCILASAATQQQQALAVPIPPQGYDYKAVVLEDTIEVVSQQFPQLMDLVDEGKTSITSEHASHKVQACVLYWCLASSMEGGKESSAGGKTNYCAHPSVYAMPVGICLVGV